MQIEATKTQMENPSMAVFNTEDRLHKKLDELEGIMAGIRNTLLGGQPTGGEEKATDAGDGFFSQMQQRLRKDIGTIDLITAFACEVRDSLSHTS